MNWKALGKVLWHGASIALEAASVLESSGTLKVGGNAGAALNVAIAVEQAAAGRRLALTTPPGEHL